MLERMSSVEILRISCLGRRKTTEQMDPWLFGIYVGDEIPPSYEEDGKVSNAKKAPSMVAWVKCRG